MKSFEEKFEEFMKGLAELKWYWEEDDVQELYLMCMHIFDHDNSEVLEYNEFLRNKKRKELLRQLEELDNESTL